MRKLNTIETFAIISMIAIGAPLLYAILKFIIRIL